MQLGNCFITEEVPKAKGILAMAFGKYEKHKKCENNRLNKALN
jgi:hypothetical protein